ncbi:Uncharacterised protein [Zhongshania aliphaticivorans]|uniref:DUF2802 domain-containing protein n=1 Tax=Zhongshania aliphaticivorans TaxID=1470434 RepID=A0A5S9NJ69_9GAMM|nr:DUF2802 domain-containing protein [Zhongshania aliphaticivorans]CAA0090637.1 Uncharacterised protein [Zhongshania aliphaticivorans]CAA0098138.1 Uncharacterised protein [Zhongshania aliphaticivorans]
MTKYEYLQFPMAFIEWFQGLSEASMLGLVLSLVGVGVLMFALKSRRSATIKAAATLETNSDALVLALEHKIEHQNSALAILGERVLALEEYLEMLGERQQRSDADKKDMRFYQQVSVMAGQGLAATELAQRCGISASEADLIKAMSKTAH